ncbi:MAG: methanethiol S-methyltransferase [Haloarculaceae archaeon]
MRLRRWSLLAYGGLAYLTFLAAIAYGIGFLGDAWVAKTVDAGPAAPLWTAVALNVGLLGVFAVQHSLMARDWFKRRLTAVVPAPAERSTYVLAASLALAAVYWGWRPIDGVVWAVRSPVLAALAWGLFALGWLVALVATFEIDHARLFGLAQVRAAAGGDDLAEPGFETPGLYAHVRHPMMTGLLLAFWATPRMTVGHLLLAVLTTGYVLVGVRLEERGLVAAHGKRYERYRQDVPMLVPRPF